jgi:hypothetical protein
MVREACAPMWARLVHISEVKSLASVISRSGGLHCAAGQAVRHITSLTAEPRPPVRRGLGAN